jgi:hypothetical protein
MNLPDAPIAREGFFVTHFFAVRDQEISKEFYVGILGGKVIRPENPATSSSPTLGSFSIPVAVRRPTSPRSFSRLLRTSTGSAAS